MSPLAGIGGAVMVAGLLLAVSGLRGTDRPLGRLGGGLYGRLVAKVRAVGPSRLAVGLAAGVTTLAATGWPVAALGIGVAAMCVPPVARRPRGADRVIARLDALAGWTRRLADLLGSGVGGLDQAVAASVRTCPPAIAEEVGALAARARAGGMEPALLAFADDVADPIGDRVAAGLILRARTGGPGLATVLDNLADAIGEQVRSRREVEADRAKPRANVRTITLLTAAVTTAMVALGHDYAAPFGTLAGQAMLTLIGATYGTAFWWMNRIARPHPGPRFLNGPLVRSGSAGMQR